jgi:hypothetical protein
MPIFTGSAACASELQSRPAAITIVRFIEIPPKDQSLYFTI